MVEARITLSPSAQDLMRRLTDHQGAALKIAATMNRENQLTIADIKQRISGPGVRRGGKPDEYVGVDTGTLRKSITATPARAQSAPGQIAVSSLMGSNLKYAAIHEYGGNIKHPRKGKPPYNITIPERSYVRRTIRERAQRYASAFLATLVRHIAGES